MFGKVTLLKNSFKVRVTSNTVNRNHIITVVPHYSGTQNYCQTHSLFFFTTICYLALNFMTFLQNNVVATGCPGWSGHLDLTILGALSLTQESNKISDQDWSDVDVVKC